MAISPATSTIALTALGKKLQDATASLDDLTFTAVGVAAQGPGSLYVQGAPASLGDTFPGTATAPITLTFVNNTATPAVITGFAASSTDFVPAAGTCAVGGTVNPAGGSCTFTAAFNPAAGTFGVRTGTVTLQTDQGNIVAGVYGRVRHDAIVTITDPAGAGAFGDVVGLTTSGVRTWTITNTGERAPSALMVAVSGANAGEFTVGGTCQGATPAPGGTCTITASVTPATFGAKAATITITAASQLENSGQTIALTARGVTTALLAATAGNGGTFGATPLGTNTNSTMVVVTNRMGTTNVQASGALMVSTSNPDFVVSGCAEAGAAMGVTETGLGNPTCTLTVTFAPTSVGTISGNLTISGTPGGSVVIPLSGTATPNLAIAPSADTTIASGTTTTFNVSLNSLPGNTVSTGALTVGLGGANMASFAIVANTCTGTTLSTGGTTTCSVGVRYTGTGAAAANLTVAGSPAGNQVTVNLIGQ
jgi:hypothetical protein